MNEQTAALVARYDRMFPPQPPEEKCMACGMTHADPTPLGYRCWLCGAEWEVAYL